MKLFIVITIGIFIVLFIFVLYSRIFITISYLYTSENQTLKIIVTFYRMNIFKKEIEFSDILDEQIQSKQLILNNINDFKSKVKKIIYQLDQITSLVKAFRKSISIHKLSWHTTIGIEQANITGVSVGGLWGIKGIILSILKENTLLRRKPQISITPIYNQTLFHTEFNCIGSIKVGKAIFVFFRAVRINELNHKVFV